MDKTHRNSDVWVMNVAVPMAWKEKIQKYMAKNGYSTYSELIRELVRKEIMVE
ncbi:MAG: ribbon-helix-helix domain-containing protein [Metallosphaera sp.]